jgi:group I intron endonuclease
MKVDYSKGKIYKITNDFNDDVYIGSTCDTLVKRFSHHKTCMNSERDKSRRIYKLMNEIGFERFRIQLIEEYPCDDKYQLTQKESEYIRTIGTLNVKINDRKPKEWEQDNKEKRYTQRVEWRKNNPDKVKEQKQKWGSTRIQCECGCEARKDSMHKHIQTKKHKDLMKNLNI